MFVLGGERGRREDKGFGVVSGRRKGGGEVKPKGLGWYFFRPFCYLIYCIYFYFFGVGGEGAKFKCSELEK